MNNDDRDLLFLSAIKKRDEENEHLRHLLAVAMRKIRRDNATIKELSA